MIDIIYIFLESKKKKTSEGLNLFPKVTYLVSGQID